MQEFYLNPSELYEVLREKEITHLHHANTVLTSLTFIKENALLSRAYAEKHGLPQTSQDSDDIDKKYDVWDSVFLDGLDLHTKFKRANLYGPVLFKFNLELLLSPFITGVVVTRTNPIYFNNVKTNAERYYSNMTDIKNNYMMGGAEDWRTMFTIRSPEKNISLYEFLEEIILDRPLLEIRVVGEPKKLGIEVHKAILNALKENGLEHVPVRIRHATSQDPTFCTCLSGYSNLFNNDPAKLTKLFRFG